MKRHRLRHIHDIKKYNNENKVIGVVVAIIIVSLETIYITFEKFVSFYYVFVCIGTFFDGERKFTGKIN